MEIKSYKCDVCGEPKGEANHWFRVFYVKRKDTGQRIFAIQRWEDPAPPDTIPDALNPMHICGLACATKAMQTAMQGK